MTLRPGGQGVAGSNPAVSTGSRAFSNVVTFRQSQQKSQLVVQRPFWRRAPIGCHGLPTGMCQHGRADQGPQSRSQRSPSHLGSALRPRTTANRPAPSPAHPLTASRTLTGVPQLQDASRPGRSTQARPYRHKREAADMTAAPRTGRHDRSDPHRDRKQGFILVMAKVPSKSPANAM